MPELSQDELNAISARFLSRYGAGAQSPEAAARAQLERATQSGMARMLPTINQEEARRKAAEMRVGIRAQAGEPSILAGKSTWDTIVDGASALARGITEPVSETGIPNVDVGQVVFAQAGKRGMPAALRSFLEEVPEKTMVPFIERAGEYVGQGTARSVFDVAPIIGKTDPGVVAKISHPGYGTDQNLMQFFGLQHAPSSKHVLFPEAYAWARGQHIPGRRTILFTEKTPFLPIAAAPEEVRSGMTPLIRRVINDLDLVDVSSRGMNLGVNTSGPPLLVGFDTLPRFNPEASKRIVNFLEKNYKDMTLDEIREAILSASRYSPTRLEGQRIFGKPAEEVLEAARTGYVDPPLSPLLRLP